MQRSHEQAQLQYTKFSYALEQLQRTLRPVLSAIDSLRSAGNEEDLDPMSRARMHISLAYAVNSLFCMYLRTQGIDPTTHPVAEEIARVQDAFMRMRKVEAGESTEHKPKPNYDRRKHIVNAKKSAARLAALVFPEEDDLLLALQGKQGRLEYKQEAQSSSRDMDKGLSEEKRNSTEELKRSEERNGANANERREDVVEIDSKDKTEGGSDPQAEDKRAVADEEPEPKTQTFEERKNKKKTKKDKKEKHRGKKKRKKSKAEEDKDEQRESDKDKERAKNKKRKSKSDISSAEKRKAKKRKRSKDDHGKSE